MSQPDPISIANSSIAGNTTFTLVLNKETHTINRQTYVMEEILDASTETVGGRPAHSLESRNIVQLYRTPAKRSGATRGSSKAAVKMTLDVAVPNSAGDGNVILPLIVNTEFSVPIGTDVLTVEDTRHIMARMLTSEAVIVMLVDNLMI